jgi:hypothetical protein
MIGGLDQGRSGRLARFSDVRRITQLRAARFPDRKSRLGALGNEPPLLLRQRRA